MRCPLVAPLTAVLLAFCFACASESGSDAGVRDGGASRDASASEDAATSRDAAAGGDTGTSNSTVSVELLCTSIHEAVCMGFSACGCSLEGRRYDHGGCIQHRASICERNLSELAPYVQTGAMELYPTSIEACVAGIEALAADCQAVRESSLPLVCGELFGDTAAIGGVCSSGLDGLLCADGSGVCAEEGGRLTCAARPAASEACIRQRCAAGLECGPEDTCLARRSLDIGGNCRADFECQEAQICHPERGVCSARFGELEGPCRSTSDCADSLTCSDEALCVTGAVLRDACGGPTCGRGLACVRHYANRSCQPKSGFGGPCTEDRSCDTGFVCTSTVCGPTPVANEACAPSLACGDGLLCNVQTFTCTTAPGLGETCSDGPEPCAPGLGCTDQGTCAAPGAEGSDCLIPSICAPGLACDFTAEGSVCSPRRGEGAECQNHVICEDGLYCDFSGPTCQPWIARGADCPEGGGCAPGDECEDLLGGYRCHEIPSAVGAPCAQLCAGDLACFGPGGACAPEICGSP